MIFAMNNKQAGIGEDVSRQIKRLLRFSLSRFAGIVIRVKVRCYDINGPKGGLDKRCHITAKLNETGQVIVQGQGVDYIEAITNCLERLVRTIRREIDRRQNSPIRKIRRENRYISYQDEILTLAE